jgi:hypothetical protein
MTYSVGGKIEAADYNALATSTNELWGVSNVPMLTGYGQTQITPTVAVGTKVLAATWAALVNTVNNIGRHQDSSFSVLPVPAVSTLVSFQSINTILSSLNTTRFNAAAQGTDITNSATRTAAWGTAAGVATVTSTVNVSFANTPAIYYFFNTGGTIRITASRTGGTATPQNTAWTQLCTDIGTLALPGRSVQTPAIIAGTSYAGLTKLGGGGSAPDILIGQGFYGLEPNPRPLFRQYSNQGVYTSDYIQLNYSYNNTNTLTISVAFTDVNSGGSADSVDGSLTVTAVARPPATTYISASWGTPVISVTAPQ